MSKTRSATRASSLDPRTKFFLILTLAIVLLVGGYDGAMAYIRPLLAAVPMVLVLCRGTWKIAFWYAVTFVVATATMVLVVPHVGGMLAALIMLTCGVVLRLAPSIAAFYYLVATTTVGDFVASLERMHLPQAVVIPVSVMFRFVPTLAEENAAIGAAMRMRGIRLGRAGIGQVLEYRLIPVMMSAIRIGEELSAAALTRGLGAPNRRTTISRIGFGPADVVCMLYCAAGIVGYILSEAHVI